VAEEEEGAAARPRELPRPRRRVHRGTKTLRAATMPAPLWTRIRCATCTSTYGRCSWRCSTSGMSCPRRSSRCCPATARSSSIPSLRYTTRSSPTCSTRTGKFRRDNRVAIIDSVTGFCFRLLRRLYLTVFYIKQAQIAFEVGETFIQRRDVISLRVTAIL